MPRRKKDHSETVDELLNELESASDAIQQEIKDTLEEDPKLEGNHKNETDKKRDELLKLAEDGEISKSVSYVKKSSKRVIENLYSEYERKRAQKANEFLTDLCISRFASIIGGLNAIETPEALSSELKNDELLKRDVYQLVETLTPYIPFLGFLSGGGGGNGS